MMMGPAEAAPRLSGSFSLRESRLPIPGFPVEFDEARECASSVAAGARPRAVPATTGVR
ncbi:MAG: hypothetical protein MZV70_69345 [Desulfobacterales bacterium]|nr:hypothetical protein [Desulfobacterales bacterium]